MRRLFTAALLIALAGCAAPRTPAPVARPLPTYVPPPPVPAPLANDWRDWPLTPGDWRYNRDSFSTLAIYGSTGVTISCDNDHQVRLRIDGRGSLDAMTIRTTSATRAIMPTALGHPPTGIALAFSARDPLLDAIAFSRGRFIVEQAGQPTLVLPVYAEIGRVIEDCRG